MVVKFIKNRFFQSDNVKEIDKNRDDTINIIALLIEASAIDGRIDDDEKLKIIDMVSQYFKVNREEADTLYKEARIKQEESTSFHSFTSKIHQTYSYKEKINILEMLWEVVLVNKDLHDFESSLMRRICGLLHLKDTDNGIVKKRAMKKLNLS
tara:strand:+ start:5929 stop:6387 length:459 start_codon:yes stop_codon:yes gene_type:complete